MHAGCSVSYILQPGTSLMAHFRHQPLGPAVLLAAAALSAASLFFVDGAAAAAAPPPPASPLAIELQRLPDEVKLPSEKNYIFTAVVRGGEPTAVWVARAADSPFTVPLTHVGDNRYQVNLADDPVELALWR